jgi:hypothetical protein
MIINADFSVALSSVKAHCKIRRGSWRDKQVFVKIRYAHDGFKLAIPAFVTECSDTHPVTPGDVRLWYARHEDIMARDWEIIEGGA